RHGLACREIPVRSGPSARRRCYIAAASATFFYSLAPISVFTGREFMPDVPSLSLAIIGLYYFLHWTDYNDARSFAIAAGSIALAILIKAPTALIGAPILSITYR